MKMVVQVEHTLSDNDINDMITLDYITYIDGLNFTNEYITQT